MLLFPPTSWWMQAIDCTESIALTLSPKLKKGLAFNRYSIITANGLQHLSVPLKGGRKQRVPLSELAIDYRHDWQRQHWGALYSAYGRAPFFEHYGLELEAIIHMGYERLMDLNHASIEWAKNAMRASVVFDNPGVADESDWQLGTRGSQVYHQVFEDRWGFTPELSILDLLMNEGPYSAGFLVSES